MNKINNLVFITWRFIYWPFSPLLKKRCKQKQKRLEELQMIQSKMLVKGRREGNSYTILSNQIIMTNEMIKHVKFIKWFG